MQLGQQPSTHARTPPALLLPVSACPRSPLHFDNLCLPLYVSCREEIMAYSDPTIMHKLQLQLAIAEERFEDATA